eukprot:4943639-Amphidinium_carterae.1
MFGVGVAADPAIHVDMSINAFQRSASLEGHMLWHGGFQACACLRQLAVFGGLQRQPLALKDGAKFGELLGYMCLMAPSMGGRNAMLWVKGS